MSNSASALPRKILFIPLLLTLLAILIATIAAISGQQIRYDEETLRIARDTAVAQGELTQAIVQNADPATIDKRQKNFDEQKARQPVSYAQPGRHFTNWDGYRYEQIILAGYAYHLPSDPPEIKNAPILYPPRYSEPRLKNVAWYPLYPLLGWLLTKILPIPAHVALTLISQVSIALASIVLFLFARRYYTNRNRLADPCQRDNAALLAVAALLFGPCAIFLYANFTESLFVLLLVSFLYCLDRRWWLRAAAVAALASACRSQGVLFGPILAIIYLVRAQTPPLRSRLGFAFLLGVISSLGILAYMLFLQIQFHDPIAFMHAQKYWNVGINTDTLLNAINPLNALHHIFRYAFQTTPMDWPRLWESLCLVWPPIVLLIFRRRLSLELTIFGWMLWALPYVSNGCAGILVPGSQIGDSPWMSMGRFMAVLLPAQILFGEILARRHRFALFFLLASSAVFTFFAFKFGLGEWIG